MRYCKKPVIVDAVQFIGWTKNKEPIFDEKEPYWLCEAFETEEVIYDYPNLIIKTLEGNHTALLGDFIIQGVEYELYPCKPDIFRKTYELVVE